MHSASLRLVGMGNSEFNFITKELFYFLNFLHQFPKIKKLTNQSKQFFIFP